MKGLDKWEGVKLVINHKIGVKELGLEQTLMWEDNTMVGEELTKEW